jgi:hypothetical protein
MGYPERSIARTRPYTMRNIFARCISSLAMHVNFVAIVKHCIIFTEVVSFTHKALIHGMPGLEVKRHGRVYRLAGHYSLGTWPGDLRGLPHWDVLGPAGA